MSNLQVGSSQELGHPENCGHVRQEHKDVEKQCYKEEHDSTDHISIVPSHSKPETSPKDLSLARTKSRASVALSRVATALTTKIRDDPGPPPDGGTQAWLQVFCAWLAIFNTWGFVNAFGAFQSHYENTLPQSASTISWIGSVQAFMMFFIGTFSGRAQDAGLFRPTIALGVIVQVFGIFMMSLSTRYWHFVLSQGLLTGIGGGLFFCPVMGLMATYFLKKRGIAFGIATTGNALGGAVYPLVVRQLLPKVGFAWTVRVLGFLNLITLACVVFLMKPRLPPRKQGPIIDYASLRDIPYILFVLGCCCLMAAVYFVFYYISSFATDETGMDYTSSLNLVIILNAVGVPARILPGFLADRYFGVLNTFIPILCVNVLVYFCWTAVSSLTGLYIWTVMYGVWAAAFQSLFPTATTSLGDDLSKAGTRLGMAFSAIGFAALVGGPLGGAILSSAGGKYTDPIIWGACTTACGTALVVAARIVKTGTSLKIKC